MYKLIDKLRKEHKLQPHDYATLLECHDSALRDYAAQAAREVAHTHFGCGVYVRGLIEITSYCRNDCYYCGLRCSNREAERYRLSVEQIMECCRVGYELGFRTFVMQGGEDGALTDQRLVEIVSGVRERYPDCAITLSLGERSRESYELLFKAGANRYLLRHETANAQHYAQLHPATMSLSSRMAALHALRDIGYQTGTGFMVGSPGQTTQTLVEDLLFIENFRPQMVGIGPYLPQTQTPFAGEAAGDVELTLLLLSIFRLMLPHALIPSTTALASIAADGRERGILAGANVVMPNLSPSDVRAKYAIYDHKRTSGPEAVEGLQRLAAQFKAIGYRVDFGRGDYQEK